MMMLKQETYDSLMATVTSLGSCDQNLVAVAYSELGHESGWPECARVSAAQLA